MWKARQSVRRSDRSAARLLPPVGQSFTAAAWQARPTSGGTSVLLTSRRSPQHHGLCPRHADVPDAVPVANVLLHELAHGPRRGGLEAGDKLRL